MKNRKARNLWLRSLALTWITILFAGLIALHGQSTAPKRPHATWSDFGGNIDSLQYSSLKQITKSNVSNLKQAWFYKAQGPRGTFPFSPLIADRVMYVIGEGPAIVALDATTGKQIWSHPLDGAPTNRGINYWESEDRSDGRIIFAVDSYLQEINARTGMTINTFGNDGRVNLREGPGPRCQKRRQCSIRIARTRFRKPDRPWFGAWRIIRLASRRSSRLRCADRKDSLDVPHCPSPR